MPHPARVTIAFSWRRWWADERLARKPPDALFWFAGFVFECRSIGIKREIASASLQPPALVVVYRIARFPRDDGANSDGGFVVRTEGCACPITVVATSNDGSRSDGGFLVHQHRCWTPEQQKRLSTTIHSSHNDSSLTASWTVRLELTYSKCFLQSAEQRTFRFILRNLRSKLEQICTSSPAEPPFRFTWFYGAREKVRKFVGMPRNRDWIPGSVQKTLSYPLSSHDKLASSGNFPLRAQCSRPDHCAELVRSRRWPGEVRPRSIIDLAIKWKKS